MVVNDNACILNERGVIEFIASKLRSYRFSAQHSRSPVFSYPKATKNLLSPFPVHEQNTNPPAQEI